LREQIAVFDKAVLQQVRADPICRLLMTVPGIGALSALMYVSTVESPSRFSRSRAVGAHLGLTPRRYQSGETDRSGHISRCGDGLARTLMYEAATVILHRVKRPLHLKDWAQAIERRSGSGKARVALARKLSVILHSVWRSGEPFRWAAPAVAAYLVETHHICQQASPQGEGAGNCAAGRWARVNASPLWTLQCLSSGPDQMLRQPALTAKRTMTRAGDLNGGIDAGGAIREPPPICKNDHAAMETGLAVVYPALSRGDTAAGP